MNHTADTAARMAILQAEELFAHLTPEERIRAHATMMRYHQGNVARIELDQEQKTADPSTLI